MKETGCNEVYNRGNWTVMESKEGFPEEMMRLIVDVRVGVS